LSYYYLEATAFAKLFVRETGTDALIRLMESVEDNRKLISAATPLEVYAAIRRRERADAITAEDAASALEARQLLDRTVLRWPDALQLGAALTARDMFPGTAITFVSASASLLDAAKNEGLETLDPANAPEPAKDAE
jgi:hypothetical protein